MVVDINEDGGGFCEVRTSSPGPARCVLPVLATAAPEEPTAPSSSAAPGVVVSWHHLESALQKWSMPSQEASPARVCGHSRLAPCSSGVPWAPSLLPGGCTDRCGGPDRHGVVNCVCQPVCSARGIVCALSQLLGPLGLTFLRPHPSPASQVQACGL